MNARHAPAHRSSSNPLPSASAQAVGSAGPTSTTQLRALGAQGYAAQAAHLSPLQARSGRVSGQDVHAHAAKGIGMASSALPHLDAIQTSFGKHDVSGVKAQVGGPATEACQKIGAPAYAADGAVAFADAPDLHTAAHEAAHVVQQRGGVQLKGGVGQAGDRYERHADAVADLVVRGESAEGLLSEMSGSGAATTGAVQKFGVGGAVTADDDLSDVRLDTMVSFDGGRTNFPIPGLSVGVVGPGPVAGAYMYVDPSVKVGWSAGTDVGAGSRAGARVYGQGRADLGLAVGTALGQYMNLEAFGGCAAVCTVEGSFNSEHGAHLNMSYTGALLIGFKIGKIKFQQQLGSLEIFKGTVSATINEPAEDEPYAATWGNLDLRLGDDLVAIIEGFKECIDVAKALVEGAQEAAYDGIAMVMPGEDPRAVRERINAEIERTNQDHGIAGGVRQDWLSKGAHYTAANNIAACWFNREAASSRDADHWNRRYQAEMDKTIDNLFESSERACDIRLELIDRGVDEGTARHVEELYEEAFTFPGYYVRWGGERADEQAPQRSQHLKSAAAQAERAALDRVANQRAMAAERSGEQT